MTSPLPDHVLNWIMVALGLVAVIAVIFALFY